MSFCLRVLRLPVLMLLLLSYLTANSQSLSPVAASVAKAKAGGIPFPEFILFSRATQNDPEVKKFTPSAQVLHLDADALSKIYEERPAALRLQLPYHNALFILELIRVEPLTPEFRVQTNTSDGLQVLSEGIHYRGLMRGDEGGFATVSIFENEVYGLIADSRRSGNLVLGALKDSLYILYADEQTTSDNPFTCDTPDKEILLPDLEEMPESAGGCVRIYWEVNNLLFQNKGSLQQTYNYTTAIFNQMAGLYANESIDVYLSQLFVWVTQDPYSITNSAIALSQFRQLRTQFEGDLAHLIALSPNNLGGIAYVDAICDNNFAYAYSCIRPTYSNVPVYSWTVEVVTHETGHNLGANHTHWCGWPGGAIDNCRPPEGNCAPGLPPVDGGTIMSYCHLTPAGINFSHGFGPLPGDLIRSRTDQANCQSAPCPVVPAICPAPASLSISNISGSSATCSWTAAAGASAYMLQWRVVGQSAWHPVFGAQSYDLQIRFANSNLWQTFTGLTTTNVRLLNLKPQRSYQIRLRSRCSNGSMSDYTPVYTFSTPALLEHLSDQGANDRQAHIRTPVEWQVFPNPAEAIFTLQTDTPIQEDQYLFIFNLLGQMQLQRQIPAGVQSIQIDVRELPAGTYWLRLPQNSVTRPLIKI